MPVGNPKPQTIANKKYQEKAGYISKSFKLKRDVVQDFSRACDLAGVSQSAQLTEMMKEFSKKQK